MYASRPARRTIPPSPRARSIRQLGVDEFEPETRPAWPRKSDDGLGTSLAEQDVDAGSSPEKRTMPVDAGLGCGGAGMGEYAEGPGTGTVRPGRSTWLVKQMALELEATEWMAMDDEEVLQVSDFVAVSFP
ncbi:hypothetical protein B0H14DRAFT_2600032 [Mycena olivaceomarginata]|nr:hypothetical protein B0H14DRAFT_2600032 [Mycena olivaceomarginata]